MNVVNLHIDIYSQNLRDILNNKTNTKWNFFKSFGFDLFNWYKCDHFLIEDVINDYLDPNILYFNILENSIIINSDSLICFCDESYIKYKGNVLRIVNEVMNSNEQNIELQEIEINRQLNDLFGTEVFCYITKYLYISEIHECVKMFARFGEYNILILNDKLYRYPLKENWIQNVEPECDRHIIQKGFEEQNYLLHMNCVKLIEYKDISVLLYQESTETDKDCAYTDRQHLLDFDDSQFKFSIQWINGNALHINPNINTLSKIND
jgi:hypothetical protein